LNNGGRRTGWTVPSASAQEAVLRDAYRRAHVDPGHVQYVELHGTGTKVGDPVEASALGAVLGAGRHEDNPLLVGSVKTNLGHLEGAAGIAGLLKTILMMRHREVPASLNFEHPRPEIRFRDWRLRVPREAMPWPGRDGQLLAGVSSFGMGGANCHVVLASAPSPDMRDARSRRGPIRSGAKRAIRWVSTRDAGTRGIAKRWHGQLMDRVPIVRVLAGRQQSDAAAMPSAVPSVEPLVGPLVELSASAVGGVGRGARGRCGSRRCGC
jgi:acyl transferase domain-containing protein